MENNIKIKSYSVFNDMIEKSSNFYDSLMSTIDEINNLFNNFDGIYEGPIADNIKEQWNNMYDYFNKLTETETNNMINCLTNILNSYIEADNNAANLNR